MVSEYVQQANTWAEKWDVKMSATFTGHRKYFPDDTDTRDTYSITLVRGDRSMTFDYGQSLQDSGYHGGKTPYWREWIKIANAQRAPKTYRERAERDALAQGKAPDLYSVICCIEKYEPEPFADWCANFGYDTDSRKALATYLACQKNAADFARLCRGDEEMMHEAQNIS